jgi:hypothetical protein
MLKTEDPQYEKGKELTAGIVLDTSQVFERRRQYEAEQDVYEVTSGVRLVSPRLQPHETQSALNTADDIYNGVSLMKMAVNVNAKQRSFRGLNLGTKQNEFVRGEYDPKTGKIKHIIIPPDIANQLIADPNAFQVNETLTRNIGMRRAESEWIVNTNIDIIPPSREELVKFVEHCDKNTFYTISRREAPLSIFDKYQPEQWKEFYNELTSTIGPRLFPARVTPNDTYSIINCCGDFQIAHKDIWYQIKGFEEQMYKFCFIDSNVQKKAVLNNFGLEARFGPALFHIEHGAYKINEKGEKEEAKEWNQGGNVNKYNDSYKWVETFQISENDESWGLGDTEIEYEIY